MSKKMKYEQIFNSRKPFEVADFIAIKICETQSYYVTKCRFASIKNMIISQRTFEEMISQANLPIILSNEYVELPQNIGNGLH